MSAADPEVAFGMPIDSTMAVEEYPQSFPSSPEPSVVSAVYATRPGDAFASSSQAPPAGQALLGSSVFRGVRVAGQPEAVTRPIAQGGHIPLTTEYTAPQPYVEKVLIADPPGCIEQISPYFCEFLGTFMLTFTVGCCSATGSSTWNATAIGLVLMALIYALGPISGGHFNPAVSIMLWLLGKIHFLTLIAYILVQVLAGFAAACLVAFIFFQSLAVEPAAPYDIVSACICEAIYTAMLCFVVASCAASARNNPKDDANQYYALAIGFVIIAGGYACGNISGAFLNPALSVGFNLAHMVSNGFDLNSHLNGFIYAGFECIGLLVATAFFALVRPEEARIVRGEAVNLGAFKPSAASRCISEFVGTFLLVLTVGLNLVTGSAVTAWSAGAALTCMVYSLGDVSGAHFNPAVTFAVVCAGRGKCSGINACNNLLGQLLAGIAAGILVGSFHSAGSCLPTYSTIGLAPGAGYSWAQAGVAEFVFTFLLAWAVLAVATIATTYPGNPPPPKRNFYFALVIGACVTIGGFAVGSVSGGSLNPAVSLGLSVEFSTNFSNPSKICLKNLHAPGDSSVTGGKHHGYAANATSNATAAANATANATAASDNTTAAANATANATAASDNTTAAANATANTTAAGDNTTATDDTNGSSAAAANARTTTNTTAAATANKSSTSATDAGTAANTTATATSNESSTAAADTSSSNDTTADATADEPSTTAVDDASTAADTTAAATADEASTTASDASTATDTTVAPSTGRQFKHTTTAVATADEVSTTAASDASTGTDTTVAPSTGRQFKHTTTAAATAEEASTTAAEASTAADTTAAATAEEASTTAAADAGTATDTTAAPATGRQFKHTTTAGATAEGASTTAASDASTAADTTVAATADEASATAADTSTATDTTAAATAEQGSTTAASDASTATDTTIAASPEEASTTAAAAGATDTTVAVTADEASTTADASTATDTTVAPAAGRQFKHTTNESSTAAAAASTANVTTGVATVNGSSTAAANASTAANTSAAPTTGRQFKRRSNDTANTTASSESLEALEPPPPPRGRPPSFIYSGRKTSHGHVTPPPPKGPPPSFIQSGRKEVLIGSHGVETPSSLESGTADLVSALQIQVDVARHDFAESHVQKKQDSTTPPAPPTDAPPTPPSVASDTISTTIAAASSDSTAPAPAASSSNATASTSGAESSSNATGSSSSVSATNGTNASATNGTKNGSMMANVSKRAHQIADTVKNATTAKAIDRKPAFVNVFYYSFFELAGGLLAALVFHCTHAHEYYSKNALPLPNN